MMQRPLRILYTIPNFDTAGSGKALLNIAQRLDRQYFEPHILCRHDRGRFFEVVRASGIPVHLFEYTAPMTPRWQGIRKTRKISQFLRTLKVDLIHSFHYADDYSEPLASRWAGIRWVYTKKNMSWGANAWKARSWLAHGIAALNTDMINHFFKGWTKVKLIPRGVDVNEFKPDIGKRKEYRERMQIAPHDRVIITVANLVPVKGVEVLLTAFEHVGEMFPNAHLWIVGDDSTEYAHMLKQQARRSPMKSRIHFMGKVMNVKDYLNAADIYVMPTLSRGCGEGFGVAMLEAMATEKVVIGSEVSGIRDQLKNFSDHLFAPGDSKALAGQLTRWLQADVNVLENVGKAFRQEVIQRFSIEKEVRHHQMFYEWVMRRRWRLR